MTLSVKMIKEVQLIKLDENITFSNARLFRDSIEKLIEKEPAGIVVDLKHVNFINSTGIGILAAAHGKLRSLNKHFVLLNVRQEVIRVLKIIGFDTLIFMTDDEDEAISYCLCKEQNC
jgi:anti-anti-sigma factor